MKFDKAMLATTLAVSAAVLAGCEQKQCVDAQGKVVAEVNCKGAPTVNGNGNGGYSGPHFSYIPFWMMWGMGHGGAGFGRPSAPAGEGATGATARGGFGGTASGHGGAGE
jgi:hypothetical protein